MWLTALAVLVATPGLAPVFTAGTAVAAEAGDMSETERAQQAAVASGAPVEVVAERTERDTVFANPDGETFTLRKSIAPVRVEQSGGGWATPDATLFRRADGSIGPKAAAVDLSFSSGGDGRNLVTIGENGQSVTLGWPGELPEPSLEGQRAVYEDVRPDVNLILTATVEGFRQVLEVETLEAASDPALASLEYSMQVKGLRIHEGTAGTMDAVDGNGQVVFRAPSARMWNSAGGAAADGQSEDISTRTASVRPMGVVAQQEAPQDPEGSPAGPADEGDPLAGPGTGDEAAVLDVDVTSDALVVTPDTDLIAGTTSSELPLYIDPSVELNESERTLLSSDGDVFYNFSGGDNGMSVGRCGSAVLGGVRYYCTAGSAYTNRMYFEFKPDKLKGKHVLDATFAVTETWSFSCDARWVDLERTDPISKSSKWPGPGGPKSDNSWDQIGDRNVSAGRGSACSPSQPRAPIEFNDNPEEPDENLTSTVRAFADGKFSSLTLMLKAKDESDPVAWKRFDDDAVIDVVYVGKPAVPTEYGLETGTSQVCSKSATAPTLWADPLPNLAATPQTVAGGEASASLRVYFDIDVKDGAGAWADAPQPSSGSLSPASGYVGDGVDQNKRWSPTLADNRQYRYRAWTQSYYNSGKSYLESAQTPWCYFTVDSKGPKPPSITFNSVYSACLPGACTAKGAPGTSGSVTFGPAAGSGDANTAYQYKLSTDSTWRPWKSGATVTETITPVDSGTVTLEVQTRDAVGRTTGNGVRFLVAEAPEAVGRWTFNETSGAAVDVSAKEAAERNDAAVSGGVRTITGRRGVVTENGAPIEDKALKLNGQAYAATSGPVVKTQVSYTVAAWVRLDSTGRVATALGQDGTYYSPFFLGYCDDVKTWCLRMADADAASTALDNQRVNAREPAQTKVWTHVAAVVDVGAKKLTLYVNGVEQGTDTLTTGAWAASGGLQIGRAKYKGSYADHFPGDVDEVAVWQEAKASEAIAREASPVDADGKAYAELVAQYAPEGATGTSLSDLSGYGNTLSLSAGASLDGEALLLNGLSGAGTVSRPLVADTGSFTIATMADVDTQALSTKPDGYRVQVLGQSTATGSSWSLWAEKTGTKDEPVEDDEGNPILDDNGVPKTRTVPVARWQFGRLTADGSGISVASEETAVLDSEVSLVGAYDARTREITLFVGSTRQGDPLAYAASVGSAEFAVGKGRTNSAWGHYLAGRITDIRLWAGAVTDPTQVEALTGY
ncbi:LamG domain-containing protein [Streptomyces sp. NPDC003011]